MSIFVMKAFFELLYFLILQNIKNLYEFLTKYNQSKKENLILHIQCTYILNEKKTSNVHTSSEQRSIVINI